MLFYANELVLMDKKLVSLLEQSTNNRFLGWQLSAYHHSTKIKLIPQSCKTGINENKAIKFGLITKKIYI